MRFQRIIEQVYFRPWFITAESHAAISRLVKSRMVRAMEDDDEPSGLAAFIVQRPKYELDLAGIAHVWVFGALGQGMSPIEKSCGNTDYADLSAEIARAHGEAKGLFLHVDSGGGMCAGCVEVAREIAQIGIPSLAFTDSMMGSAAYCQAVGCDQIFSTPSAMVGSIGTICPWIDSTLAWEMEGMSYQPVVSEGADLKGTGSGPSLTEEQRASLQETVDDYSAQFVGHVKTFRAPDDEVFRGAAYVGDRALAYGLTDALASQEDAYRSLLARIS